MLRNKTRKTVIAKEVRVCKSPLCKAKGLMFTSEKAIFDKVLIFDFFFERRISLHMIFVFYPIDVIFLDGRKRVVETATLKPFCINYTSHKKAKYVIECRNGSLAKGKVRVGDFLEFK